MSLSFVMSCTNEAPCFENFVTSPGSEKSNIIALALVEKGQLAEADITEALLDAGTAAPDDVIEAIRTLQLAGKAMYFPNGHLNGMKSLPEEKVATNVYGLETDAKPTGEVTNMFQFKYEYFFSTQTVKFMNWLRQNLKNYDVVYWTEKYVHVIEKKKVTWYNIGSVITGNAAETISGGFDMKYLGDGEPVPYGPCDASLLEGFTSLTITDPVLDALKLAKDTCSSNCNVFTAVAGGALSTTLDFNVTGQSSCLTWKIFLDCSTTPLADDAITVKIHPLTGIVTVTSMPANTTAKFRVVAISDACVIGEYCMKLVTKPA